jgi:hypothetical protein
MGLLTPLVDTPLLSNKEGVNSVVIGCEFMEQLASGPTEISKMSGAIVCREDGVGCAIYALNIRQARSVASRISRERPFAIWMPTFIQIAGGEQWLSHQHHNKNRRFCCPYL